MQCYLSLITYYICHVFAGFIKYAIDFAKNNAALLYKMQSKGLPGVTRQALVMEKRYDLFRKILISL